MFDVSKGVESVPYRFILSALILVIGAGASQAASTPILIAEDSGYSAYLLDTMHTGLEENYAALLRITKDGQVKEEEWYVNCNAGFPQVVSADGVNTHLVPPHVPASDSSLRMRYRLWELVCGGTVAEAQVTSPTFESEPFQCPDSRGVYTAPDQQGTMIIKRIGFLDQVECSGDIVRASYNGRELYFVMLPMRCGEIDVMFWDDHSPDNVQRLSSVVGKVDWSEKKLQPLPTFRLPPQTGMPPGGEYVLRACYTGE